MTLPMQILLPAVTAILLTVAAGVALVRGASRRHLARRGVGAGDAARRERRRGLSHRQEQWAIRTIASQDASSQAAESLEVHETVEENGVARMRPLEEAHIPAGGTLVMRPGGTHLMLMGLDRAAEGGRARSRSR